MRTNGHPLGFALGTLGMSVALLVGACAATLRASSYADAGLRCVDENTTRAAADACRCQAEKDYQQPLAHCPATDGGTVALPIDAGADR